MSSGGARRGRRDNGLDAAEFAVAGDVDPRVGEHLLDELAVGGIAAYLQPASDLNPITRTTTMPSLPTDRLFVDRAHLGTARTYLSTLAADDADGAETRADGADEAGRMPPAAGRPRADRAGGSNIDAEWARIVAGYHTELDPGLRPWPVTENLDPSSTPPPDRRRHPGPTGSLDDDRPPGRAGAGGQPTRDAGSPTVPGSPPIGDPGRDVAGTGQDAGTDAERPRQPPWSSRLIWADGHDRRRRPDPEPPSLLDGLDTFGADLPDDETDRYQPPPPPPLPTLSPYALVGVLAILVGFVLFLYPALIPLGENVGRLVGFAGILGGFGILVMRLRPGGDDDDVDRDDGAIV